MDRISENALAIDHHLKSHPKVAWVNFAGLPGHPEHGWRANTCRRVRGILSFGLPGGREAWGALSLDALRLFTAWSASATRSLRRPIRPRPRTGSCRRRNWRWPGRAGTPCACASASSTHRQTCFEPTSEVASLMHRARRLGERAGIGIGCARAGRWNGEVDLTMSTPTRRSRPRARPDTAASAPCAPAGA